MAQIQLWLGTSIEKDTLLESKLVRYERSNVEEALVLKTSRVTSLSVVVGALVPMAFAQSSGNDLLEIVPALFAAHRKNQEIYEPPGGYAPPGAHPVAIEPDPVAGQTLTPNPTIPMFPVIPSPVPPGMNPPSAPIYGW